MIVLASEAHGDCLRSALDDEIPGMILAAADITQRATGPRPMAGSGQHELIVDVPPEHSGKNLHEARLSLLVDMRLKSLVPARLQGGTKRSSTKPARTKQKQNNADRETAARSDATRGSTQIA